MSADGCSDPSVVEWKDKLMMMTACDDGRRRVCESGDKGDSWTEALGTLSRVWGNKNKGPAKGVTSGFITATIDGADSDKRNVMLVTLPVYSSKDGEDNRKGELHLWLTDNAHIVDIGPVSEDGEDAAASSLLYKSGNNKKEELIALYEKKKGDEDTASHGMVSVLLTAQLKRVKEVLATWNEVDKRVSKLCPISSATEDTSSGTACGAVKITDGLVGFLSGKFSDGTWRDEYLGVNATVRSGAAAATGPVDGVTFTGRGAGAQWPVGSQGENQLYHFANYNFTLVATVSIHEVPEEGNSIPLMGVRLDGGEKSLWSCRTTAKRSGGCCAVTERPRSLKALGIHRNNTNWPLCYRMAARAPFTSMVSVCVGVCNVNWKLRIRRGSHTSTLEGMEAAQGAKKACL
ncbi:trans-sialidase [Trypanosoma cruzi]|nr:trans-sialidase [Trypanosoma cruzi]